MDSITKVRYRPKADSSDGSLSLLHALFYARIRAEELRALGATLQVGLWQSWHPSRIVEKSYANASRAGQTLTNGSCHQSGLILQSCLVMLSVFCCHTGIRI
jgi:hypothetical protein